jgi:hypothetical protein
VRKNRPALFRGRHFEDEMIVLCVRWYLRYSLSYRDLEEMMAERGLSVDHSTGTVIAQGGFDLVLSSPAEWSGDDLTQN